MFLEQIKFVEIFIIIIIFHFKLTLNRFKNIGTPLLFLLKKILDLNTF